MGGLVLSLAAAACREPPPSGAGAGNRPGSAAAGEAAAVFELAPGVAEERSLAGGEAHAYELDLAAGQFLRVVVDQRGVDVELALDDPRGRRILAVDSPTEDQGSEELVAVAEVGGRHRLRVHALVPGAAAGRYEVRLEDLRPATEADHHLAAGARAFHSAHARVYYTPPQDRETEEWAIATYGEALDHFRAAGDRAGEAKAMIGLAFVHRAAQRDRQALELFDAALPILRQLGDTWEESIIIHQMGEIHATSGDYGRAIGEFGRAQELRQQQGLRVAAGKSALYRGWCFQMSGESQRALSSFDEALAMLRPLGDTEQKGKAHYWRARLLLDLGQEQEALDDLTLALAIAERLGDFEGQALARTSLGKVYWRWENFELALEHLHEAQRDWLQTDNRRGLGITWDALGHVHQRMQAYDKASAAYGESRAVFRQVGDRPAAAIELHNLGAVYLETGRPCEALDSYRRAREQMEDPPEAVERASLVGMARAAHGCGDLEEARRKFEAALRKTEQLRSKTASYDLRSSYFATQRRTYEAYIDLLMDLDERQPGSGWDARALAVSERARARSLVDSLLESGVDLRRGADPELLRRERELEARVDAIERHYLRLDRGLSAGLPPTHEELARVTKERRALLRQLDQLGARIRAANPSYAALARPEPLDAETIQRQVLDRESLLLEYALGNRRSFLWALTSDSLAAYPLPGRSEIEARARRVYRLLTLSQRRQSRVRAELVLAELSDLLLGPVAERLAGRRLLIVADGALHYIPFGALPLPGSSLPLIVEHEVVRVPSASALAVLRRQRQGRPPASGVLALVADPVFRSHDPRVGGDGRPVDVPAAAERDVSAVAGAGGYRRLVYAGPEADEILARVPGGEVLTLRGFAATREAVVAGALGDYRILHFATHADLDAEQPSMSRLVLSLVGEDGGARENGFVFGREIYDLDLNAELVVLSACETALGREVRGEGLVGLTQGFLFAGAARVVVSLWNVNDRATAELMSRFYHHLLEAGRPPAAALRAAQIDLWRELPAPYYWAGFVLQGEWR